eukprot:13463079-Alexandrium_andersonii.AAC.1
MAVTAEERSVAMSASLPRGEGRASLSPAASEEAVACLAGEAQASSSSRSALSLKICSRLL